MKISFETAAKAVLAELSPRLREGDACWNTVEFSQRIRFAGLWFDDPSESGIFFATAQIAAAFARCWSRPEDLVLPACVSVLRAADHFLDVEIQRRPGGRGSKILAAAKNGDTDS